MGEILPITNRNPNPIPAQTFAVDIAEAKLNYSIQMGHVCVPHATAIRTISIRSHLLIMPPPLGQGALSDDARLTSVCLTSICRVHRA